MVPELNLVLVIVAAIAVLLPGYTISLGIIELVGRHVVSGTAHLMSGLVYLAKQLAGAWLGAALVISLLPAHPVTAATASWFCMALAVYAAAYCRVVRHLSDL